MQNLTQDLEFIALSYLPFPEALSLLPLNDQVKYLRTYFATPFALTYATLNRRTDLVIALLNKNISTIDLSKGYQLKILSDALQETKNTELSIESESKVSSENTKGIIYDDSLANFIIPNNIQTINLYNIPRISYLPNMIVNQLQNITTLNIGRTLLGNELAIKIAEYLSQNSPLTSLILINNDILSDGGRSILNALEFNTTLTYLDLSNNYMVDDGPFQDLPTDLGRILTLNSTLQSLVLQDIGLQNFGFQNITIALAKNKGLTFLDLSDNEEDNHQSLETDNLAESIKVNTNLTSLNLNFNIFENISNFLEALEENKALTSLKIAEPQMSTAINIDQKIANLLRKNRRLLKLDLRVLTQRSSMADAIYTIQSLTNSSLTYLDLEGAMLTDTVFELAEALKTNRNLTHLSVAFAHIEGMGLLRLLALLPPNIVSLNLSQNLQFTESSLLKEFQNFWVKNQTVRSLVFDDFQFKPESIFDDFAEIINQNKTLTSLSMANLYIPEDIWDWNHKLKLDNLYLSIANNTDLTYLNLRYNLLGFSDLSLLAEAIKVNRNLESLNLENNHIGTQNGILILDALKYNQSLTDFNLEQNNIYSEDEYKRKELSDEVFYQNSIIESIEL